VQKNDKVPFYDKSFIMTQNAQIKMVGRFCLAIHTKIAPTDQEWNPFLQEIAAQRTLPALCTLVFTDGGAPNGAQRKRLSDALQGRDIPIAVHSHALIPRFVNASIALFNKSIRSYNPEEFPQAIEYLQITTTEKKNLTPELLKILQEMGPENLQTLKRSLLTAKWI
jgi:hypothetical protein